MTVFELFASLVDSPSIPWKSIITGFCISQFAFETYLTYRQYKVLQKNQLPPVLVNEIDKETLKSPKNTPRLRPNSQYSLICFR